MRVSFGLLLGIVLIVFTASGCGPGLTEEELGTVIYDAKELPGADQPYELPEQAYPSTEGASSASGEEETDPATSP